jgi:uncharacterized protein with HEPN domain
VDIQRAQRFFADLTQQKAPESAQNPARSCRMSTHPGQDDFKDNQTLRRAFVRSLELIGEASKKLPEEFRDDHPDIDWRAMAGMRDRLIHNFNNIDITV